jgi:hypothetical protein
VDRNAWGHAHEVANDHESVAHQVASPPSIGEEDGPNEAKVQDCTHDAEGENAMDGTVAAGVDLGIHRYAFHDVPSPTRDDAHLVGLADPSPFRAHSDDCFHAHTHEEIVEMGLHSVV